MRNYIDKFVTVSVNSFIKTKKIDIARAKIEELKKQKKEYGLKADTIRKKENIFDGFCKEIALLHDFNELDKFVRNNSVTEEHSNACCPRITKSRWTKVHLLFYESNHSRSNSAAAMPSWYLFCSVPFS